MLNWITGANRSTESHDDLLSEPPETPAHLFAVKALKTAFWGTPAPYTHARSITLGGDKQQSDVLEKEDRTSGVKAVVTRVEKEEDEREHKHPLAMAKARHADPFASPTKGILVTPGASTSKRKTVSFGGLAKDLGNRLQTASFDEADRLVRDGKRSVADVEKSTKEDLRRSLFQVKTTANGAEQDVKETKGKGQGLGEAANAETLKRNPDATDHADSCVGENPDVTIDLSSPRSRSGKHWKQEYHRDHDASKAEMKELIKRNQITKTFAEQRDKDATRLTKQWESAEAKVKEMEAKVSKLAAQLMNSQVQDEQQMELVNEVASQTAKAMKYKQKVEKYKTALSSGKLLPDSTDDQVGMRDNGVYEHDGELSALKSKVSNLQSAAAKAQERAQAVEKENKELKNTLARVKTEMKKFEVRNREREERRKRKDEKAAARYKELEEALEKANAQNTALQQELEALRAANSAPTIDRIQNMRRRLRDLEHTDSPDQRPSQVRQKTASPRRQSFSWHDETTPEKHNSAVLPSSKQNTPGQRNPTSLPPFEDPTPKPPAPPPSIYQDPPTPTPTPNPDRDRSFLQSNSSDVWTATLPLQPSQPSQKFKPPTSPKRPHRVLLPLISNVSAKSTNDINAVTTTSPAPSPSRAAVPERFLSASALPQHQDEGSTFAPLLETPASFLATANRAGSLGERSRAAMPPEREAAARRRLAEKMAGRKASRKIGTGKGSVRGTRGDEVEGKENWGPEND